MTQLNGKTVLIRADSSTQIGTGHVMRTHVLAQVLKRQGAQITYACRNCDGNLIAFLTDQGYRVTIINHTEEISFLAEDYSTWLGATTEEDMKQSFNQATYNLVILDHYGANIDWQRAARQHTKYLIVIDDEAIQNFDCDILINQNYHPSPKALYHTKIPSYCNPLIGPQYALLRPDFKQERCNIEFRNQLKHVLVMMGGADHDQVTFKIAKSLDIKGKVTVIVGNAYQNVAPLQQLCAEKNFKFIQGAQNIAELMGQADFCIGAGGSTSWERCCTKLPSALFSVAHNQRLTTQNLEKAGASIYLGAPQTYDYEALNDIIANLQAHPAILTAMSQKAGDLSDGKGVKRILENIQALF